MSENKPCQHCSKRRATKRILNQLHVKDMSTGTYGDDLASSSFKFEVCDVCARLLMDTTAIQMRNYALDLTKDGQYRALISNPGTNLDKLSYDGDEWVVTDVEEVA